MRRVLGPVLLVSLALPQVVLASTSSGPREPGNDTGEAIRAVFVIFAIVVLLIIAIKWVFLWRKIGGIRPPKPGDPKPEEPQ